MKINEISPLEHIFTEKLKTLALIPKMLYFYGNLPEIGSNQGETGGNCKCGFGELSGRNGNHMCSLGGLSGQNLPESRLRRPRTVAIVGSRKNTAYGKEVAYRAAYEAAKAGAVVVSGLAYGIDSIAHRGALDAGGVTVAVLGTPIDEIYPKAHLGLAREILQHNGAIISEYGPGETPRGQTETRVRFLARNRIIAALADVVLIAEAAARSGSLNTAMHALDTGVDLMAVPGDVTRLSSDGCNRLLSQGAIPYTRPGDLLDLLFPERLAREKRAKSSRGSSPEELIQLISQKVAKIAETELEAKVLTLILTGVKDGDEIIKELGISAAEFGQTVTMLEIKGAIKSLGANTWMGR